MALADEKLARWFGTPYRVGEDKLGLSVRMGLALSPDHGEEADALFMHGIGAAESQIGGDRYLLYMPRMSERVCRRMAPLEDQLHEAIERDEFVLFLLAQRSISTAGI